MVKITWYPGHMKKTKERIQNHLKVVDLVVELVDSRIPYSSKNPLFDQIVNNKKRLILFTKSDLVNRKELEKYVKYYESNNAATFIINLKEKQSIHSFLRKVTEETQDIVDKYAKKGFLKKEIKMMIIGVPNVGKSTLINILSKRKATKVGNVPGVTKSEQWINIDNKLKLLDMPGILWENIEDKDMSYKLAICKNIKPEIINWDDVTLYLINLLKERFLVNLNKFLGSKYDAGTPNKEILQAFAVKYNINTSEDYERVYNKVITDFNEQKFGKIIIDKFIPTDKTRPEMEIIN